MLITAMCCAEILGMLGVFAFPALLPRFMEAWNLSNAQAGWINGIYFAGYTVAVPLLTSLTDRMDARRIYLVLSGVGALANLGFCFLASGFWTALAFRAMSGLGLAGTYVPGLKALIDRVDPSRQPRAISFYTACFGLGMSLSFLAAGEIDRRFGWQAAFGAAAAGSGFALLVAAGCLNPIRSGIRTRTAAAVFDFRAVWQNRSARAYILTYMCHMWEMFAARSWLVAFLSFSISLQGADGIWVPPTTVMALAGIGGMIASIAGGELALRFGRRRTVAVIMWISAILALAIGFTAALPYPVVAGVCILYTLFFQGDSAAIHAGVILSAEADRRGATMALQSLAGFAAASIGSVAAGFVLELSGEGRSLFSWALTFASMGAVGALGPILASRCGPRPPSVERH
ncbi:MAG: MFS transporter [Desulfobacterales bacterium]